MRKRRFKKTSFGVRMGCTGVRKRTNEIGIDVDVERMTVKACKKSPMFYVSDLKYTIKWVR